MNQEDRDIDTSLQYQLLKLKKTSKQRVLEGKVEQGLDKCDGLRSIDSDRKEDLHPTLQDLIDAKVEFLMVVTMYNENIEQFNNTLDGIKQNVTKFKEEKIECSKLAVVVIVDGIAPFSRMLSNKTDKRNEENVKGFKEFYDRDMIREEICNRLGMNVSKKDTIDEINGIQIKHAGDEIAHCFMRKISILKDSPLYLQVIFCVKHLNLRKLNSHLWFFGGFCKMIKPRFVMLIDVGTKPLSNSLYYLYEALNNDSRLAGVCGEIRPMKPSKCNFIKMAQAVEYMYAHVFDKALESAIGFISVLPGAFSAYRWRALDSDPLWKYYFKSVKHPEVMECYDLNMYLAEDRVLSLALLSQPNTRYFLRYVKRSVAETDVPGDLSKLLAQRRRWINGSWFALIEVISNFNKLSKSNHGCCQRLLFRMQLIYMIVNVLISWITVGSFFLGFAILISKNGIIQADDDDLLDPGNWLMIVYLTMLVLIFILSIATKANLVVNVFNVICGIIGLYMWGAMLLLIQYFSNPEIYEDNYWVLGLVCYNIGLYVIAPLLHNPCYNIKILALGFIQFITLIPTYVNVFQIYSICNIQDVTWGNRPDKLTEDEKRKQQGFDEYRTKWVIIWVISNSLFAFFFRSVQKVTNVSWYMWSIAILGFVLTTIRFLGALIYLLQESPCCRRQKPDKEDENEMQMRNRGEEDNYAAPDTIDDKEIIPRTFREPYILGRVDQNGIGQGKMDIVFDGAGFRYEEAARAGGNYIEYFSAIDLANFTDRTNWVEESKDQFPINYRGPKLHERALSSLRTMKSDPPTISRRA
jgi:cellulose synthase/poly-beta-1,6-N-acetylglucosamine synthase-like glycosyltransferase